MAGVSRPNLTRPQYDQVHLIYSDLLAQSGADQVFVHIGYGDKCEDRNDHEMKYTDEGWEPRLRSIAADS